MDIKQLESWFTSDPNLTADQKAVISAAFNQEGIKTKVATLREQSEFATIESQRQQLQAELEGTGGKPGSRAYQQWYAENAGVVHANAQAIKAYDKKHGADAFAKMAAALEAGTDTTIPTTPTAMSKDDILRIVREDQSPFVDRVATVVKSAAKLVQRHLYAGRKTEIDFEKLDQMMLEAQKAGRSMSVEDAYNEWDKPEREKATKAAEDARVEQRVTDELKKRGASANFPSGADMTPSALSLRPKAETDKFDRAAMTRSLQEAWNNPEGVTQ
jgi:hypothetical protein